MVIMVNAKWTCIYITLFLVSWNTQRASDCLSPFHTHIHTALGTAQGSWPFTHIHTPNAHLLPMCAIWSKCGFSVLYKDTSTCFTCWLEETGIEPPDEMLFSDVFAKHWCPAVIFVSLNVCEVHSQIPDQTRGSGWMYLKLIFQLYTVTYTAWAVWQTYQHKHNIFRKEKKKPWIIQTCSCWVVEQKHRAGNIAQQISSKGNSWFLMMWMFTATDLFIFIHYS